MPSQINTLNRFDQERQAFLGKQEALLIASVPVGSLVAVGSALLGQALPNGTYTCMVDILGLANKLTLLLKATFAGTCVTSGGTTMLDLATIITAFVGIGGMATTVRQTVTLTPITGERIALLTIVVAGGAATFTEAECYGN